MVMTPRAGASEIDCGHRLPGKGPCRDKALQKLRPCSTGQNPPERKARKIPKIPMMTQTPKGAGAHPAAQNWVGPWLGHRPVPLPLGRRPALLLLFFFFLCLSAFALGVHTCRPRLTKTRVRRSTTIDTRPVAIPPDPGRRRPTAFDALPFPVDHPFGLSTFPIHPFSTRVSPPTSLLFERLPAILHESGSRPCYPGIHPRPSSPTPLLGWPRLPRPLSSMTFSALAIRTQNSGF